MFRWILITTEKMSTINMRINISILLMKIPSVVNQRVSINKVRILL